MIDFARTGDLAGVFAEFAPHKLRAALRLWDIWAREEQLPPPGDWTVWLVLGGRGAGKTRAGAEWVRAVARGDAVAGGAAVGRIALIGENLIEAREVMVEGPSGLLAVHGDWERPAWQPSRRRLEWPNGAVAQLFSAADPESLRGPQFGAAWADELAKWPDARAAWDMLQFALRLGARPRQMVTTTPRNVPLLKEIIAAPRTVVTRMATRDNAANLAPGFLDTIVDRYQGTRLGRQELDGELIEDRPDALWQRGQIELLRLEQVPPLTRIVVAVDPPATSGAASAACGIVAAGLDANDVAVVIRDATIERASPEAWALRAVATYHELAADALVAEVNQGGEMVATVIRQTDRSVPVRQVRASRGKWVRAEPVALLYAQGRVRHAGTFPALEDQMCDFGRDGLSGGASPDRLDALVWAVTALLLERTGLPQVRRI